FVRRGRSRFSSSSLSPPPSTSPIYTLSLHDALPIWRRHFGGCLAHRFSGERHLDRGRPLDFGFLLGFERRSFVAFATGLDAPIKDRKSTRLNSSHLVISYAVFCLKKKIIL